MKIRMSFVSNSSSCSFLLDPTLYSISKKEFVDKYRSKNANKRNGVRSDTNLEALYDVFHCPDGKIINLQEIQGFTLDELRILFNNLSYTEAKVLNDYNGLVSQAKLVTVDIFGLPGQIDKLTNLILNSGYS